MSWMHSSLSGLREVTRLIWSDTNHFVKVRLAVSLLLILASSLLAPLGPLALKLLVDRLTNNSAVSMLSVALLILLYIFSQWLARCLGAVRGFLYSSAQRRMSRLVSERLFAHIMQLPMKFHLNRQTGALSQILDNGLQGYHAVLQNLLFTLLPLFIQLATVAVILVNLKQTMFLAMFGVTAILYSAVFAFFTLRITRAAQMASMSSVDATAIMTDSILNYETVKFFAAEPAVQERVSNAFSKTERSWLSVNSSGAVNAVCIGTVYAAFLGISTWYAAAQVAGGGMTIGDFVMVNAYLLQLMAPLESFGSAIEGFAEGIAMLGKMLELLREPPEPKQIDDQVPLKDEGDLQFERVSLSYRPGRAVIQDVNFHLPAGKTLGIVGASGAGKSTLIRLLVRLFEPDTGRILLDGVPTTDIPLAKLRHAIAIVPQDTVLFNETIGYNIGFGKYKSTMQEIEHAAKIAHLHDFIMGLPEKYDTKVGERGVKLSGGEKQRVSIARAAIKRPNIYVFDEATSSLDSKTEREILYNLREIALSSTTIIIAHRLSTVVHADEIIVLDRGTVVEQGTHTCLLALKGLYATLWDAQREPDIGRSREKLISKGHIARIQL